MHPLGLGSSQSPMTVPQWLSRDSLSPTLRAHFVVFMAESVWEIIICLPLHTVSSEGRNFAHHVVRIPSLEETPSKHLLSQGVSSGGRGAVCGALKLEQQQGRR